MYDLKVVLLLMFNNFYLWIIFRFQSSKSGKIYLHTDVRLIFARDKFEFDPQVANYELRSFTEGPDNPKFSPKRW